MLQTLSVDIRECYLLDEQCRRLAETALTPSAKTDFVDMERRWLSLARNYEFAERLPSFTKRFGRREAAEVTKNYSGRLRDARRRGAYP